MNDAETAQIIDDLVEKISTLKADERKLHYFTKNLRELKEAERELERLQQLRGSDNANEEVMNSWELVKKSNQRVPGKFSWADVEYQVLRLTKSSTSPYFEINNTYDDEGNTVDFAIHNVETAQSEKIRIHTRHKYRFDKPTAFEVIDDTIEKYSLPKLDGELQKELEKLLWLSSR